MFTTKSDLGRMLSWTQEEHVGLRGAVTREDFLNGAALKTHLKTSRF